jgi:periplasmic protein TonB
MALRINPRANLKAKYQSILEISFIISLGLLIAAFKFFPRIDINRDHSGLPPVIICVVDVQPTSQLKRPPPPAIPEILIASPGDDEIIDIILPASDIDLSRIILPPPIQGEGKRRVEDEPFIDFAEVMPEPVGGLKAIQSRIIYPELARRGGIEGKVHVLAFVNENGDVVKAEIIKGAGAGLDEEAIKAVKETKFRPGQQRGRPVKVQVVIPIVFRLQ